MDPNLANDLWPFAQTAIYDFAKYLSLKAVKGVKKRIDLDNAIKKSVAKTTEELDDKTQKEIVKAICKDCKDLVQIDVERIVSQVLTQNQVSNIDPQSVTDQIYTNILKELEKIPDFNDIVHNRKIDKIDRRSDAQNKEILGISNKLLENQTLENERLIAIEKLLKKNISKSEQKNEKEKQQPSISANELDKYYFRDTEINLIREKLLSNQRSLLALSAEGGIGKSTIAREIMNNIQIQDKYPSIIWVDYVGNLDDSILNAVDWHSEVSERTIRLKKIKEDIIKTRSQILLIIDNVIYNQMIQQNPLHEDGVFTPINVTQLSAYVDVLITTRIKSIPNYDMIRISGFFRDKVKSTELFMYHYNSLESSKNVTDKEIPLIHTIVSRSKGNPYIIMLLAKQAARTSIKELHDYLEKYFSEHDYSSLNTVQMIKTIIEYKKVTSKEKPILLGFAVLPNIFISDSECSPWFGYDTAKVIDLANEGLLEIDSTNGVRYRMHDLVKKAVKTSYFGLVDKDILLDESNYVFENHKMTYQEASSEGLLPQETNPFEKLVNSAVKPRRKVLFDSDSYSQVTRLIEIYKVCLKVCILKNNERAVIYHLVAELSFRYTLNKPIISKYYHNAVKCLNISAKYDVVDREKAKIYQLLSDYSYDYGYQLSSLDKVNYSMSERALDMALTYLNKTYQIVTAKKEYDKDCALIASYIETAIKKQDFELVDSAFLHNIIEKYRVGDFLNSYARILDHKGYLITIANNSCRFKTAVLNLEIAYSIAQALYKFKKTEYKSLLSRIEDNLGYLLFHIDENNYERSEDLISDAVKKRKELLRIDRDSNLSVYSWSVNNYAELLTCIGGERLDEAEGEYLKAIRLRTELDAKNNGKYQHYIAWSTYGLGRCLARKKENDRASDCFKEAKDIYKALSKNIGSFNGDYAFVQNSDIDIEEDFKPWIGNQTHFS